MSVEAIDISGKRDTSFNRFVRVSMLPGTVVSVTSPPEGEGVGTAEGRNVQLVDGYASEIVVHVNGAFGPSRIAVEDIGYQPGDPTDVDNPPACADGIDNDGNGLIDFPADTGCAFSNDNSEAPATFAAGVSPPINFVYPKIADVQGCPSQAAIDAGRCAGTPFSQEGVTVETRPELGANVVVTRVSNNGLYVTDTTTQTDADGNEVLVAKPYGSLFVFNFGLPAGVLVCDRVTQLTGTMDEFFGYTEMNFPTFEVEPFDTRDSARTPNKTCKIPEPFVISPANASNDAVLEAYEAGLVRIRNAHVPKHFGSVFPRGTKNTLNPATDKCGGPTRYTFETGRSNCDFDGSGDIDFSTDEGFCSCFCYQDPECSEWSVYRGRGTFRAVLGPLPTDTILVNASGLSTFDPADASQRAAASTDETPVVAKLLAVTGTLANFSGGPLNWTIESRCEDDVILCPDSDGDGRPDLDCADDPQAGGSATETCIGIRTGIDEDPGAIN